MENNNKEDKFSDIYAEGEEFAKLLGIKHNKDISKLLKNENDFISLEEFDKVIENVKEEDYSEIKKELDKICSKLPIRKGKNGAILLDRNNPDDLEWWNEDEE